MNTRPKFSSSDKGQAREMHYVLGKIFKVRRGGRRKSNITIEDLNGAAELWLEIFYLIIVGLCKLVVWLFKKTKELIIRYREKKKDSWGGEDTNDMATATVPDGHYNKRY